MDEDNRMESILTYLMFHPKVTGPDQDRAEELLVRVVKGEKLDESIQKRLLTSINEKDEKQRLLRLNLATKSHTEATTPKELGNEAETRRLEDDRELDRRIQKRALTPEAFIQSLWTPEV